MAIFSFIAGTAAWAGIAGAIGTTAAGAIIAFGQSLSWSIVGMAMQRRKVDGQTVKATISQADQPRIRGWGRLLLGGVRSFHESAQGELFQLVVCHHGRVDGLIQFWWDGKPVSQDAEGRVSRYKRSYFRDGSGNGGDYTAIPPRNLSLFPALWTAQHRLEGQATFLTCFGDPSDEDFGKYFPNGPGTKVQVEVRGSRVRNLLGFQQYTENAGLCIRDFMTHPDGWGFPLSKLDDDSWANFVTISSQTVALKNGGTEPRYSLCGFYALDESLKDVTARMLSVCDAQLYETAEGKIGILGGAWSVPDVTITDADILEFDLGDGDDPLDAYNVLKGSFVSPAHAYQPIEVREIEDAVSLANSEVRTEQLDLDMCPSGTQLQRLMKIKMAKDRREIVGTLRTNLVGMKARWPKGNGIHTIGVVAPDIGLNGVFEVTGHTFDIPSGFCEIGIASLDNPYGWHAPTEETDLPLTYTSIPTPDNPTGNPAGAVLTQERVLVSSGVYGAQIAVTVDNPDREGLRLRAETSPGSVADVSDDGPGEWVAMTGGRLRAKSGILDDNTTHTVRIKWAGRTDWVNTGSITVRANAEQPDPPTSFSAVAAGGVVALDWVNAASNFYQTQIFRNSVNNFSTATHIKTVDGLAGQVSGYDDDPPGASALRYYWAITINGSGVASVTAGPVTATA
ncbi:hypothetical protein [Paracoccus aestuariivivens]|uniref:Tip attachment protein J domain-containing protein n=1 Tax=Paracoccus aestuariivivens TaxID=1820333 RepID=A0A6L6J6Q0_9RHOB|nr:hypothetical protein [Paracoccus aestuariivivens]MTH76307.1 hypothetical protein [Paracoccus aestuariivivens]